MRRRLAVGNWKMNGLGTDLGEIQTLSAAHPTPAGVDILICPPTTLISQAANLTGAAMIAIGGQDCHAEADGAHTGDISALMLKDAGARAVILGHSERRSDHAETSALIRDKARSAHGAELAAIICLGETLAQREATATLDIIDAQLAQSVPDNCTGENLVIAYEPVWAIGSGLIPMPDEIGEVHRFIRARLERRFGADVGRSVRLLYGGSVKAENAASIFGVPDVDGALVGGASLSAADFSPIIRALEVVH